MSKAKMIYRELMERYPALEGIPVWKAYEILLESCQNGGKVLVCGNGGSAADADHIVGELMKGFVLKRPLSDEEKALFSNEENGEYLAEKLQKCIPAISLNAHTALITAIGNDTGYDMVFAQQVFGYGRKGDVLIAMSTSGNSVNVVNAARTAKSIGMKVIGITGEKSSRLGDCSDVCLQLPTTETYKIQEYTLPIYHALCLMLEKMLFE